MAVILSYQVVKKFLEIKPYYYSFIAIIVPSRSTSQITDGKFPEVTKTKENSSEVVDLTPPKLLNL